MGMAHELEELINEYLCYEYDLFIKIGRIFELVDIKFTEDEFNITAFIIYTIA